MRVTGPATSTYDVAILGAGAAGLLLARRLAAGPWRHRRVVLVDKAASAAAPRRWAFWSTGPEPLARHRWSRIEVTTDHRSLVLDPAPLAYWQTSGADLLADTAAVCGASAAGFEVVEGHVDVVEDGAHWATVHMAGTSVRARWVLDSTDSVLEQARPDRGSPSAGSRRRLWFSGRVFDLGRPLPDATTATLIDQADAAGEAFGFGYLLPYSQHRVFAEVTRFTSEAPGDLAGDLQTFVQRRLSPLAPVPSSSEVESASIALRPRQPPRRRGRRVLAVGEAGGLVRASTGYGFTRMRHDADVIASSLERHGHPFDIPTMPRRHPWLDAVLLELMGSDPAAVTDAFDALFARNPTSRVLRFLDGRTTPWEDLRLVSTLPTRPFIRTAASLRWKP